MSCRNPTPKKPSEVRPMEACRGPRAWRARKEPHETEEARMAPAALTARAKQERGCNDKEHPLAIRESDQPIVSRGRAQARTLEKGLTR